MLLLLGAAALDASGIALADDPPAPPPVEEEVNGPPELGQHHQPNTPYAVDDAIPFNQLSAADQAGALAAGAKTTYAETVHSSYSAIAHAAAEAAAVAKAARQSGTNGLEDVGVEP